MKKTDGTKGKTDEKKTQHHRCEKKPQHHGCEKKIQIQARK